MKPRRQLCAAPIWYSVMHSRLLSFLAVVLLLAGRSPATAADDAPTVSIAAAANFIYALDALNQEFKRVAPNVAVTSTTGSSGSLYAQIKHGAPFDLFLSADTDYPQQIVSANLGERSTLQVFATGRLVAWTTRAELDLSDLARAIRAPTVRKIAIAQPRTAPYGRAAQAALDYAGAWHEAEPKLVLGENITQTAQFIETGNAEFGLVALSLVLSPRLANRGHWKEIPPGWYATVSLDHAAVLTKRGDKNAAARRYLQFLQGEAAKKILQDFGYRVP